IPEYDIMGNLAGTNGDAPGAAKNPVGQMHRTRDNRNQVHRLFGNVYAEIDLLPSLTFRSSFGGDLRSGLQSVITYPEYENTLNAVTNAYGERSEEHTSELQSPEKLVCSQLLEKKNT